MCGIIAIVSRKPNRPAPTPAELIAGLERALSLAGDPAAVAAAAAEVDAALHGLPGVLALADRHDLVAVDHGAPRPARRVRRRGRRRARRGGARRGRARRRRAGTGERGVDRAARRAVGDPSRPAPDRSRGRRLGGTRRRPVRPAPATSPIQQAFSAIDRMEVRGRDSAGIHVFVWNHGLDLDDPAIGAAVAEPRRRRRCSRTARCGSIDRPDGDVGPVVRLQGRRRDRRARRQHGGDAGRRRRRPAAAPGAVGNGAAEVARARPHPLGQRRHHLRAQRPPGEQRRGRARWRRATRVATMSSACSTATSTTTPTSRSRTGCASRPDHHRRQGDPRADRPPRRRPGTRRRRRRPRRGVPAHGCGVRGVGGDRSRRRHGPRAPVLLALKGSGQGVYVGLAEDRYIVASEPYGIVEETDRFVRLDGESGGQLVALDAAQAGTLDGVRRFSYDGTAAPGRRERSRRRRGDDPRHRPRRGAALPAQGDHGVAGQLHEDAARQDRRAATACSAPWSAAVRSLPTSPSGWPPARSRGSR